ncbi:PPOX class F420-dependent oxidoreductase [Pseudonocardia pini]|uniref:PPOX class F420-dependent oxidoreductase n=1 Tax=Pseudonocardia pini TaxID=2758030 RepID=UPI0015F0AC14|nr:PPOX class F420-dependent oxidoreductase [Pseudonocardia pini]
MAAAAIPATHADLAAARGVGVLSTVDAAGMPQATAIWFLHEDGVVRTSLLETRQKVRNLRKQPKASLLIVDPANPYRTLELRGEVTFDEDPDRTFFRHIVTSYGGDPDTFPDDDTPRVTLNLTPSRVVTFGAPPES